MFLHQVAGLVPNCVYEFRLRISNPRAASLLSPPLLTMTPPNAPDGEFRHIDFITHYTSEFSSYCGTGF